MPEFKVNIFSFENRWPTLDEFTRGYITCMFFTEEERLAEQVDATRPGVADLSTEALDSIKEDCADFQKRAIIKIGIVQRDNLMSLERIGQCFWYDRNGHGVGFMDEQKLDETMRENFRNLADEYPEVTPYFGDDGEIYLE